MNDNLIGPIDESRYSRVKTGEVMREGDILKNANGQYVKLHHRHWNIVLGNSSEIFRRKADPNIQKNVIKRLVKELEARKKAHKELADAYIGLVSNLVQIKREAFYPNDSRYHTETLNKIGELLSNIDKDIKDGRISVI